MVGCYRPLRLYITHRPCSSLCVVLFVTILFGLWYYRYTYIIPPEQQPTTYSHCHGSKKRLSPTPPDSAVHLAFVLKGEKTVLRTMTLLKSVLYYQGRVDERLPACRLLPPADSIEVQRSCPSKTTIPNRFHLHVHLIVEKRMHPFVTDLFWNWKVADFGWTVYSLDDYLPNVNWIPNSHNAGATSLLKMVIPCILPQETKKVIVLDSDTLVNHNLIELWQHFEKFNSLQAFGLAWEQHPSNDQCVEERSWPIPSTGVNGGLMLLDLEKVRWINWDRIWRTAAHQCLHDKWYLIEGDQQLFNWIIFTKPELYYRVPCEWNVQMYNRLSSVCCPVVWPDRRPDETDCPVHTNESKTVPDNPSRLLKLAHLNTRPKPEDEGVNTALYHGNTRVNRSLTYEEVKIRFMEVYHRFQTLPFSCFS
ncbi:hypothetical protein P879_04021 [Paragonimus westermani]|uniref:Glycosyltransferase-like protein LARGE n=1 Tax=Paragonimus westermani TaxID=34504 RepID=A0A8T0DSM4_9TREM|nr:hypothetical protein P879_04021 [Paragonimus westermani]